jgi:hypothetical protein
MGARIGLITDYLTAQYQLVKTFHFFLTKTSHKANFRLRIIPLK